MVFRTLGEMGQAQIVKYLALKFTRKGLAMELVEVYEL